MVWGCIVFGMIVVAASFVGWCLSGTPRKDQEHERFSNETKNKLSRRKKLDEKWNRLSQEERSRKVQDIIRMAAFLDRLEKGDTPEEAARFVKAIHGPIPSHA
jgi:hypothetical protein